MALQRNTQELALFNIGFLTVPPGSWNVKMGTVLIAPTCKFMDKTTITWVQL